MYGLLKNIIDVFDNALAVVFIVVALLILIIDGNKYSNRSYQKELRIVRTISIFYIIFGIVILAILMVS